MQSIIPVAALALALLGALASPARAETIRVPKDVSTIQEAVDAAQPGDEIVIRGVHFESVQIRDKTDLTIRGVRGAIVDGRREDQKTDEVIEIASSSRITIRRLTVRNTQSDLVVVQDSESVVIDRCKVIGDPKHDSNGILVRQSTDVLVTRCKITDVDHSGIRLTGTACVARKNRVLRARWRGISLGPESRDCVVEKNRVAGTASAAIGVEGEGNRIERNVVSGANEAGMYVHSGAHLVTRNRIQRTTNSAILDASDGSTFVRNRVKRPGQHGIVAGGHGSVFEFNVVRRARHSAFAVGSEASTFRRNKGRASGNYDLFILPGSTENTFEDNDFRVRNRDP